MPSGFMACPNRRGQLPTPACAAIESPSYMTTKEKGFAITFVTANPYLYWCRRDESNTRPSHYELAGIHRPAN